MKSIFSYKRAFLFFAIILAVVGLRMHFDSVNMTTTEFPNITGDAFSVAVAIRHIIGSLVLAIASICFFVSRVEDECSQKSVLNGFILAFLIILITLCTMTLMQLGRFIGGSVVFSILTVLSIVRRVLY